MSLLFPLSFWTSFGIGRIFFLCATTPPFTDYALKTLVTPPFLSADSFLLFAGHEFPVRDPTGRSLKHGGFSALRPYPSGFSSLGRRVFFNVDFFSLFFPVQRNAPSRTKYPPSERLELSFAGSSLFSFTIFFSFRLFYSHRPSLWFCRSSSLSSSPCLTSIAPSTRGCRDFFFFLLFAPLIFWTPPPTERPGGDDVPFS